jgi:hypothetical protein
MDDFMRVSGFAGIAVLAWLVVSPKVHLGLIATAGLALVCLGILGIELQYQEMGNTPSFGVHGQWMAIKIGLIVSAVGLGIKAFQELRKASGRSRPRGLSSREMTEVRGRGKQ